MCLKIILFFASIMLTMGVFAQQTKTIQSANGKIALVFSLDDKGKPKYSVLFNNKPVISNAALGFVLKDAGALNDNFEMVNATQASINNTWKPVWGEVKEITNQYQELKIFLKEKKPDGRMLNIIFRAFDDGVGFRYEFPMQKNLQHFIISDELTQFNLTGDHKAFWIPGDYDTNEYQPQTSKLSEVDAEVVSKATTEIFTRRTYSPNAVQTPLMMKTSDGLYINIHEAALVNYPAMQLMIDKSNFSLKATLVPDAVGNMAYLQTPFSTPWRTIVISDKATQILSSKLILNLNEPSKISDPSWIKPQKMIGVWWEMHVGKGTWDFAATQDMGSPEILSNTKPNGTHSATTANVKKYINFAAKNNIQGVLVEGWNVGWEDWFGKWKENVFDFITPYPDFNMKELTGYAKAKGVKLIMHHETSGSVSNYERYMDTAYRLMKKMGYDAVKTGYVGYIIPRGEHHDGQWMVNHYNRVAQKTAGYKIMLDAHEPVRPTGLHRTYPNWLACEAARGNEFNAWSRGNNPEHETILPFTRLMGGPMDYTPGIFTIKMSSYNKNKTEQVHTTLCKQLALYITMYSPLQMAADLPENYETRMDAFQFIKDVAVDWDDTKIIEAEPGDYITIARKQKNSSSWFVGAITDENSRQSAVNLSFLDNGKKYTATIYRDADNAHWKDNPEAYTIEKFIVDNKTNLKLKLAAGGGCAVSLMLANAAELKSMKGYK